MSIGIACEVMSSYKRISNFNYLLMVSVILSLADIWGMAVSGKHDIYICLIEIVAFRISMFSLLCKSLEFKIKILSIPFLLAIVSVFSRLSSLAFFVALLLFIIQQIIISEKSNSLDYYFVFKNVIICSLLVFILGSIAILNFKYKNNPFYIVSPPQFLSFLFPKAQYLYSIENFKYLFNLQGEYNIFYPLILFSYTSLGLEQIRLYAYRLSDIVPFLENIYLTLSRIGPRRLSQSITAFSPITILSFGSFSRRQKSNKNTTVMFIFLLLWLFVWSLSITYTRTILAPSLLLTAYGISELQKGISSNTLHNKGFIYKFKRIILIYAIITSFITSFWGVYNIRYLPNLFNTSILNYDRDKLSIEFISKMNISRGTNYLIPSKDFITEWNESIGKQSYLKPSIIIDAPASYAYFMSHGLIFKNISESGLSRLIEDNHRFYHVKEK
tara:strand:- start:3277 stop:4605 length:1329 start_codon:yes stop_codon:yes gene_type:complete